jgi:hypothetical protein
MSGTANVNFVGGSIDQFGTTIQMTQDIYSLAVSGYGGVRTMASVNAIGVASGGAGTGTLTYTMQVYGACVFSPSACSGPYFPIVTAPGTVLSAYHAPCPGGNVFLECIQGEVDFTFGVPFSFSFGMDTGYDFTGITGTGYNEEATEQLSFLSMAVSGTGTSVDFSLAPAVPEPATFGIGLLGLFGTVGLIEFRRRRRALQQRSWGLG